MTSPQAQQAPTIESVAPDGYWTTRITPRRGWWDWRLSHLWGSRDLIRLFVWRDFVSVHKQTILGALWHVIQPLLTTVMFTVIFGRVVKLSTDGVPPFLFYMSGTVAWSYFASCLSNTSNTFVANAYLLGKVYFHRMVIPVSVVISNLISFGIQFGTFLVFLGFYLVSGANVHLTAWALLSPLLVLMLAGFGLGGGIIISALTTRYRDLARLVGFGIQLLMYATPVIYPASAFPERYRWVSLINPLTPVLEGLRLGFLGVGTVSVTGLVGSVVAMTAVIVLGLMLFTRAERTFMDTV